jgi:glycosyltransferase involved in cell wall biosynthesis
MAKKILILNWRDPQSPLEGGAERFTKKYGEFWAESGNKVWWLTNSFVGAPKEEVINGIKYLRVGPTLDGSLLKYIVFYPFYLIKTLWEAQKLIKKEGIDVVIDEIHGFPFFTPFFSKVRNVLLVCEVAGPIWDKMFPFPINWLGKNLEKLIYQVYKKTEIWAISENTKKNIQQLLPGKKVKVIDLGIDENKEILQKIKDIKKTEYPSAVFLARLVKMKGIETALEATAEIVKEFPNFKLVVMGKGQVDYEEFLKTKIKELKIEKNIDFVGKVSELDKSRYLKKAHVLLHPSFKEGFGLTVLEAGLVKTPAIVRVGSSLDALVVDDKNGFKFKNETEIKNLFKKVYKSKQYKSLQNETEKRTKHYLWDKVLERSRKITKI